MKYIVMARPLGEDGMIQEMPFIFPQHLVHADMASVVKQMLGMAHAYPVSAGEVNLIGCEFECEGSSESLQLESRPGDSKLIEMFNYYSGMI